jgi:hypothetical protein
MLANRLRGWLTAIAALCTLALTGGLRAQEGARVIEWYGYDDCIELYNDQCRVILTPAFGGKVMHYALNGKDSLVVDPDEAGFVYDPAADNRTFDGGGRFDFGPANQFPNRRLLKTGKWTGIVTGARSALLRSPVDPLSGLQLEREFVLDAEGAGLQVTQRMRNLTDSPVSAFYWARTFALGNGIVIIPSTEPRWYARGYSRKEGELLNVDPPEDPSILRVEGYTLILEAPAFPKMGFDSTAGWCAYAMPNDLLMIRTFPVYRDRWYGDIVGGILSIYYDPDYRGRSVVEIEPIGPVEHMAPGEESSFTERWTLHPFPFPADRRKLDLKQVENLRQGVSGKLSDSGKLHRRTTLSFLCESRTTCFAPFLLASPRYSGVFQSRKYIGPSTIYCLSRHLSNRAIPPQFAREIFA